VRRAIVPWTIVAKGAICLALAVFVVSRAARVPLTYDEAAAYLRYIAPHVLPEFDAGPLAVFNFEVATNHFLSTVLTKLSVLAAGSGELPLRVPALLGYALYVWYSLRLLQRLTNNAVAVGGLLLLNLNPYLLDFFALSRGYGLSIGLMTGALSFHVRGDLARTLFFASAAVLANFAMLNVYVAIVIMCLFDRMNATPLPARRRTRLLAITASVFMVCIFSQDPNLSSSWYEPVTLRLDGLAEGELAAVAVSRVDLRGRQTRLARAAGSSTWQSPRGAHVRLIRVDAPALLTDKLARIDLLIGHREFASSPHQPDRWIARVAGPATQFESATSLANPRSSTREFNAVMNWAGDRQYVASIARATTVALLLLVLFGVLLEVIGRIATRMQLVSPAVCRTVGSSALWVAALAGPPLYLLQRDRQLYFGGTRGLVSDTFYSLIESSFYGRVYHASQVQIVFAAIVASTVAFAVFAFIAVHRNQAHRVLPAVRMLALIAIVSLAVVAERWLLGTVYLTGRTALMFIPLYLLFLIFFCDALIGSGRAGRIAGVSVLALAVALSAYHFARTMNLEYTLDWRDDAATKRMMADLERGVLADGAADRRVVLGVEWIYAPVAVYYARRHAPVDITVVVPPYSRGVNVIYVAERHATAAADVIHTYPVAGTVLARPK
jgi:hypothetical protein